MPKRPHVPCRCRTGIEGALTPGVSGEASGPVPSWWVSSSVVLEKPTEMSKDIHSFIHLFTKHSLSSYSVPGARDTERRPKRPWGQEAEAGLCRRQERQRPAPETPPACCNAWHSLATHCSFAPLRLNS